MLHTRVFGSFTAYFFLLLALAHASGCANAEDDSLPLPQQPPSSQKTVFQFSDEFKSKQSDSIGKHWTDCHTQTPASFEPLGIYQEGVVVAHPKTRPGIYDSTPPSAHPPTHNRMSPGIGCAFIETGVRTLSVKVIWSGNHGIEHEPPVSHVEGTPLLFISPDNPRYGFGAWITAFPRGVAVFAGYIGSPPELFEVIATGLLDEHTTGTPREVEVRVEKPGEATIWVDGEQVSFYQGFGLNPIPIDRTMVDSTLHGFAVDAHFVDPVANIPKIKGIESIQIRELRQ